MAKASWFAPAPIEELTSVSPRFRRWFEQVWERMNRVATFAPQAVTVGGSPFLFQYVGAALANIIIVGAGVTKVEFSRDGTTFFQISVIAGMWTVAQGDYLRVTFGAAPTMTIVPL